MSSRAQPLLVDVSSASVGDQLVVDPIRDPSFQGPDGVFGALALGEFAVVVVPALARESELHDGSDVHDVVELPVPSRVQPVSFPATGGRFDRCGGVVAGEVPFDGNRLMSPT